MMKKHLKKLAPRMIAILISTFTMSSAHAGDFVFNCEGAVNMLLQHWKLGTIDRPVSKRTNGSGDLEFSSSNEKATIHIAEANGGSWPVVTLEATAKNPRTTFNFKSSCDFDFYHAGGVTVTKNECIKIHDIVLDGINLGNTAYGKQTTRIVPKNAIRAEDLDDTIRSIVPKLKDVGDQYLGYVKENCRGNTTLYALAMREHPGNYNHEKGTQKYTGADSAKD
jgi:hypothetical protein